MSIHITEAEWQQAPAGNYTGMLTIHHLGGIIDEHHNW